MFKKDKIKKLIAKNFIYFSQRVLMQWLKYCTQQHLYKKI